MEPKNFIPNKLYDALKYGTMYIIPSIATLYLAVSSVWGLPYGNEVSQTAIAIEFFLAGILGFSTHRYSKVDNSDGSIIVNSEDVREDLVTLSMNHTINEALDKGEVRLKVTGR